MPHSRPSSQRKQAPASGGYQTLVVPISQPAARTADPSLLQELELLSRAGSPGRGDRLVTPTNTANARRPELVYVSERLTLPLRRIGPRANQIPGGEPTACSNNGNAMSVDIGLGNWLYRRALRTPHRKALTFEGATWTYGELQDRIDRLASALRAHGVCRGDRVGFLGLTSPRFLKPSSPPPASAPFSCR